MFAVFLAFACLLVTLTGIGSVLRATTHQHSLAGVAFAFGSLACSALGVVSLLRLVAILEKAKQGCRWVLVATLTGGAVGTLLWMAQRVVPAGVSNLASAGATATLADVLLFGFCAFVASRRVVTELPGLTLLGFVGPALAVTVVSIGSAQLNDANVRALLEERAPAFASVITLTSGP